MMGTTVSRLGAVLLLAGLPALSACITGSWGQPSAPAATMQPETVIGETMVETDATILAIDKATRGVTLRMADGSTQAVTAPADADLSRVKVGDVVFLGAFQRLSVKVLPPGSAPLGVTRELATAKAEPGETPGRAAAEVTLIITEVAAVDIANNKVTLRGADGRLTTLDVKNPDNPRKLQTLRIGDLVEMQLIEAAVVQLRPRT